MKIGNSYSLNQINRTVIKSHSNRSGLDKRCSVSFGGKIYSNKLLDEYLKPLCETDTFHIMDKNIIMQGYSQNAGRRIAEAIKDKTAFDKKVFERELANRAMELYPELRNYRMEEYKNYYNQNEFRPPEGKIGVLKQDASDYANKKLIEFLTASVL